MQTSAQPTPSITDTNRQFHACVIGFELAPPQILSVRARSLSCESAHEAARKLLGDKASLPDGFERFTALQVHEFFLQYGIECTLDFVANLQREIQLHQGKNRAVSAQLNPDHKYTGPAVQGDDGSCIHPNILKVPTQAVVLPTPGPIRICLNRYSHGCNGRRADGSLAYLINQHRALAKGRWTGWELRLDESGREWQRDISAVQDDFGNLVEVPA